MNRALAEAIVGCLHLSGETTPDENKLKQFSLNHWERTFRWLDNAGLALYLLQHLKSKHATKILPAPVLARLEENLSQNQRRVSHMVHDFGALNQEFDRVGVNYAVMKGFSLAPAFCPDVCLRPQSDFDYLVDRQSLAAARRVLDEAGYCPTRNSSTEFVFARPPKRIPSRFDSPYRVETEPAVELHLATWDSEEHCVPLEGPHFSLDSKINRQWNGLSFPTLNDEDAFLLQVQHVFQHMLGYWVRLSWLLEMGHFLDQQRSDTFFWNIEQRSREFPCFKEFAAIVIGLTARIFGAPVPSTVRTWTEDLRPAARIWMDKFGRDWAFANHPSHESSRFPATKLVLFLHQEYVPDPEIRNKVRQRRLFPWKGPARIAVPPSHEPSVRLRALWRQWGFTFQMLGFHVGAGLRYFWELPRWRKMNRVETALASVGKFQLDKLAGRSVQEK